MTDLAAAALYQRLAGDLAAQSLGTTTLPVTVSGLVRLMSMDVMGIAREELIDGVEVGGVATFLGDAARSRVALFV